MFVFAWKKYCTEVAQSRSRSWTLPPVFAWLARTAGMDRAELLKTFNCGIGMIAVVTADRAEAVADLLRGMGETVYPLGHVAPGQGVAYTGQLA